MYHQWKCTQSQICYVQYCSYCRYIRTSIFLVEGTYYYCYYYYHHHHYHLLYAVYLYSCSCDKLCPQGIQCCSYSVVTIHGAYIVSFSVESIVLFTYCSFASIGHADIMWSIVSSNCRQSLHLLFVSVFNIFFFPRLIFCL